MSVRKRKQRPAVTIFIAALICVAVTVAVFLALGFRYISTDKGIKFIGRVQSGQPMSGRINYPNGEKARLYYIESTIVFDNGDVYKGDIKGILRDGSGVMEFLTTGDRYEGNYKDDEITGSGTYTYSNGDVYVGTLVDGKMQGYGEMTFKSGAQYKGNYNSGMRSGYGTYTWVSGARFEGAFSDDVKNGYGKMYYANGDYYEGSFVNDKRQGNGLYEWKDGESYSGSFFNSLIDTRIIDSSGSFLRNEDGTYVHGSMGVYTFATGRTYTGFFESGKVVGVDLDIKNLS